MGKSKYLPAGTNIGGHYEIIDVLGDDDFEILYLARDNHRKGSFFVLRELFLETFSSRSDASVYTIPDAQGVFDKRKKEVILEVDKPKKDRHKSEVKTYGYIKENNTIYTIMEFTNNFNLKNYLQFHPRDEIILPSLDLVDTREKKKKSFLFLKILIISVLIIAGLVFYAYKMIQKDREKPEKKPAVIVTQTQINHPALINRTETPKNEPKAEIKIEEPQSVPNGAEYIPINETIIEESTPLDSKNGLDTVVEDNAIYIDNETEEIAIEKEPLGEKEPPKIVTVPEVKTVPLEETQPISLGTKTETTPHRNTSLGTPIVKESKDTFNRVVIKNFLDKFIASSATGSVEDIASKYDYHVDRYFSLKNITQSRIKKDKSHYNRKWTKREFSIEKFKILRKYHKDGTEYCDIKTTTKWKVSTDSGKRAKGISHGFMTIKKTDNGFKVKSIYTIH